jgi:NAD(P) transhydrogenase
MFPKVRNFLSVSRSLRIVQSSQKRGLQGLTIGVPKESAEGEERVAVVPIHVAKLKKAGAVINIQSGAGLGSGYTNDQYIKAGANVVSADEVWKNEIVAKVRAPDLNETKKIENRTILSVIQPKINTQLMDQLVSQKATVLSLDSLLRTLSRGQAFDVLSSQANVAGYRAVVEAAHFLQRPFAGQMTAAGKIQPAKVMVVGAGVAGLAAIQLAKKKGAIVYGFDVRAAAKEQVESCGAKFLEVTTGEEGSGAGGYAKEMSKEWFDAAEKMLIEECKNFDVIITTAQVPGKKAPVLIKRSMVEVMVPGGVVVDLAASSGGNCEVTQPGKVVRHGSNNITIVGYNNMESRMASTASYLFSGNVSNLLLSMEDKKAKKYVLNLEDPAVRSICVVNKGEVLPPYVPAAGMAMAAPPGGSSKKPDDKAKKIKTPEEIKNDYYRSAMLATAGTSTALGLAAMVPNAAMMSTFALSCWVGNSCVKGVSHALHSPLMAMTNAISGMTIVGGMLQLGGGLIPHTVPQMLAAGAVGLSAVNLVGGTIVTKKMLDMFRRPDDPPEFNHYYLLPGAVAIGGSG